jgi:hypothetical protein
MTSHRTKMPERLWIPIQTYAADGGTRPNSGGAPFRQPSPAYPPTKGRKAPQEHFSEENFRTYCSFRKRVSRKLIRELRTQKSDNAQSAWVISRNPSTIASASEHRQPVFLHPRNGARNRNNFSTGNRCGTGIVSRRLPILPRASRLQVSQFIGFCSSSRFRSWSRFAIVQVVPVLATLFVATLVFPIYKNGSSCPGARRCASGHRASGHHGAGRGERVHGQVEDGSSGARGSIVQYRRGITGRSRGLRRTFVRPQVCPPGEDQS